MVSDRPGCGHRVECLVTLVIACRASRSGLRRSAAHAAVGSGRCRPAHAHWGKRAARRRRAGAYPGTVMVDPPRFRNSRMPPLRTLRRVLRLHRPSPHASIWVVALAALVLNARAIYADRMTVRRS